VILLEIILWRVFHAPAVVRNQATPAPLASYVGPEKCSKCHAKEAELWRRSDHAQAMQRASEGTVPGDLQDFNVAWTFGFSPLQQYLVPFPNGLLQSARRN
jgi:Cytochrome c554 and c-prime